VALSPDGKRLAIAGTSLGARTPARKVEVHEAGKGKDGATLLWGAAADTSGGLTSGAVVGAFSAAAKHLAGVHPQNGRAHGAVGQAATGNEVQRFAVAAANFHSLAFSPDGLRLAVWSGDRTSVGHLFDLATAAPPRLLKGHTDPVVGVAFAPDSKRLFSADAR